MRKETKNTRDNYIKSLFALEDEPLAEIINSLKDGESQMQISPVEGKILYLLAKLCNAHKVVEIGALGGYSAIWLARALSDNGKIYTIEADPRKISRIETNIKNCGVSHKVEVILGIGRDILPKITNKGPFDMVFIDADKANYLNYLNWADNNVRKGGLIIGDNTFLFGAVYGDNTKGKKQETIDIMHKFNKQLSNNTKYTSIILPTEHGMTIALKNYK